MPRFVIDLSRSILALAVVCVMVAGVRTGSDTAFAAPGACKWVRSTVNADAVVVTNSAAKLSNKVTVLERQCTGDPTSNQPTPPPASPRKSSPAGKRRSGATSVRPATASHDVPLVGTAAQCVLLQNMVASQAGTAMSPADKQSTIAAAASVCPKAAITNPTPQTPGAPTPTTPSPHAVAYEAYAHLPVQMPEPQTAPPKNTRTLVGLRTWLWIPASSWHPVTNSATDGPVSTTVTATPVAVDWVMGDGSTEHCTGPGTPFVVGVTDAKATKPSCSHVYTHDSHNQPGDHYAVTVVLEYAATWTSNIGPSGQFPMVELSAQVPLRVNQLQAVLD